MFIPSNSSAETGTSDITATVNSTISITTNATGGILSIPITPTPTGTQSSGDLTVNVSTNNLTGYTLSMNSTTGDSSSSNPSTSTNDPIGNALVNTLDTTYTIPSTTATYTSPTTLTTNTWGYAVWTDTMVTNNTPPTTFSTIPPLQAPQELKETDGPDNTSNTKITYAVNASTAMPSGTYANTIVFTATTNYVSNPLVDGMYMQEATQAMCLDTPTTERVVLIDARNGQEIFVQRIPNTTADGTGDLCWMETNLRYGGDGYEAIGGWNDTLGWDDDRYATKETNDANGGTNDTASIYDDVKPLTMTPSGWFGGSSTNAYTVAGVTNAADPLGTSTLDTDNRDYGHNSTYYGYLYNWCAAMGGQTGDGTANADSNNACANGATADSTFDTTISICPANWRLPTGAASGEFQKLNTAVNFGLTNTDEGLRNNFLAVYSGSYSSDLGSQGSGVVYWSSTVSGAASSYYLYLGPSYVNANTSHNKNYGRAVRCLLAS